MTGGDWIGVNRVAETAGVTRRSATRILARGHLNGRKLETRDVRGRGGKSGLSYEVSLSSLSEALERPLMEASETLPLAVASDRRTASNQDDRIAERERMIESVLPHPKGTAARGAAVRAAAETYGKSCKTIERAVAACEIDGRQGLGRKRPSNAGKPRVAISKVFDQAFLAAGGDRNELADLARFVIARLRAYWGSRSALAGFNDIGRSVAFELGEQCETLGIAIPPAALRISVPMIKGEAHHRIVNKAKNDRQWFSDNKPFIARDWTGFEPMQLVIGDVKPLDVIVTRPDGSEVYPKMVAWMDAGTGRIFHRLFMLAKGEGIRREHITETFIAMVSDKAWGFPRGLYLDNGPEFSHLKAKIGKALELIKAPEARAVIYSKAYFASSKPIEGCFARMDRYVFSCLEGHVGGERIKKKIQTVGKPPKPYPGSWDDFEATIADLIKLFNDQQMVSGQRKGWSPFAVLASWIDKGWLPIVVDPLEIDANFCEHDTRRIDRGVVRIDSKRFTHPALYSLPPRTNVQIALPWRRDGVPLFSCAQHGVDWAYLSIDFAFPADWTEGAVEAARRPQSLDRAVKATAKAIGVVDPVAVKRRMAAKVQPPVIPKAHAGGRLTVGSQVGGLAAARASADADVLATISEEERQLRREAAEMARLEAAETARLEALDQKRVGGRRAA